MPITSDRKTTHDPEVLDDVQPDKAAIWRECEEASNHVIRPDGSVDHRAAHSADPGLCSCPACGAYHWNIGRWHRCRECGFIYPSDAWAMFSWGRNMAAVEDPETKRRMAHLIERRMPHPYFRWAYDHFGEASRQDAWGLFHKLDWRKLMQGGAVCDLKGVY